MVRRRSSKRLSCVSFCHTKSQFIIAFLWVVTRTSSQTSVLNYFILFCSCQPFEYVRVHYEASTRIRTNENFTVLLIPAPNKAKWEITVWAAVQTLLFAEKSARPLWRCDKLSRFCPNLCCAYENGRRKIKENLKWKWIAFNSVCHSDIARSSDQCDSPTLLLCRCHLLSR